jgi:hypothetical protein
MIFLSKIAARVKRMATGVKIRAANHMPRNGETDPVSARLSPIDIRIK